MIWMWYEYVMRQGRYLTVLPALQNASKPETSNLASAAVALAPPPPPPPSDANVNTSSSFQQQSVISSNPVVISENTLPHTTKSGNPVFFLGVDGQVSLFDNTQHSQHTHLHRNTHTHNTHTQHSHTYTKLLAYIIEYLHSHNTGGGRRIGLFCDSKSEYI